MYTIVLIPLSNIFLPLGEFGIVYKARLSLQMRSTRLVAVKTLKGIQILCRYIILKH